MAYLTSPEAPSTAWEPWRCCIEYSPSFLHYGVAIIYNYRQIGFFEAMIHAIVDPFFINFVCFVFIMVVIVAHIMLALERQANSEQFPKNYLIGIDDAVWCRMVGKRWCGQLHAVRCWLLGGGTERVMRGVCEWHVLGCRQRQRSSREAATADTSLAATTRPGGGRRRLRGLSGQPRIVGGGCDDAQRGQPPA